jgi:putative aldouronate transport system permease protein
MPKHSTTTRPTFKNQLSLATRNYELYLFLVPAVVLIFCFAYLPMYGVQIAFRNYSPFLGITKSAWVGLEHFFRFFHTSQFKTIIPNTFILSLYGLVAGFPMPIILALMMNSLNSRRFRRVLQTITYMPYFISVVVLVSMLNLFMVSTGLFNQLASVFGLNFGNLLAKPETFRHAYVWSGIWQGMGWNSIIYLAALSSVDPTLYEAATIDGANKFQKIVHIDLATIAPTCIILLILSAGGILSVGFEKAFLMQNTLNLSRSEVINTYVFKVGIQSAQYSFSAAIGLFNTVINFVMLILVNRIARKFSETSLW